MSASTALVVVVVVVVVVERGLSLFVVAPLESCVCVFCDAVVAV